MKRNILLLILMSLMTVSCCKNQRLLELTKLAPNEYPKLNEDGHNLNEISAAYSWLDKNGKNFIVFQHEASSYIDISQDKNLSEKLITVKHFVIDKSNAFKMLKVVKNQIIECSDILNAGIIEPSLRVTDLNKDGISEISYMMNLSCNTIYEPTYIKFVMLTNGNLYDLKGYTKLVTSDNELGGNCKYSPLFKEAPVEFLNYAKRAWIVYTEDHIAYANH